MTAKFNPKDPIVRSTALKFITKHRSNFTAEGLAEALCTSVDLAEKVIEVLNKDDYVNIQKGLGGYVLLRDMPISDTINLEPKAIVKIGVMSDIHMVSKFCREDVLASAVQEFKRQSVDHVIIPGNLIDGEFRHNKYELKTIGLHNQCKYVADHFPDAGNFKYLFLTADCHEGWYVTDTGINIGWYMEQAINQFGSRNDFKFIGHGDNDIIIDKTRIKVMHPGGGSAYATSYSSQKIAESFQGGEKPHILLIGHYHKFDYCYPREISVFQCGCLQDQTSFMRKHKIAAHVGFLIIEIQLNSDGIPQCIKPQWFPFYDRKHYSRSINA